ncbi:MAG: flagellar biosynthetic protein FliO [Steroidobacteraceae bacterium]
MRALFATLITLSPAIAGAADAALFAAPAQPSVPAAAGGALRIVLSLSIVLLAIFAAAWLARRLRRLQASSGAGIELISQATLGTRERAVLLRVGGERLLVGVAAGSVTLLHRFDPGASIAGEDPRVAPGEDPNRPNFAALLRRSLGL